MLIVVGVVLGIIAALLYAIDNTSHISVGDIWEVFPMSVVFGIIGAIAGFVLTIAVVIGASVAGATTSVETNRTDIITMNDINGISGSWSLFGGSIDNEPVFYYYTSGGGASTLNHVSAEGTVIYEDSDSAYLQTQYITGYQNKVLDKTVGWLISGEVYNYSEFHVPAGSIQRGITLDAK